MKLRLRAPPTENRPRKSSFLSRHCRAKVTPSAWKHTSKLASSMDVVTTRGPTDGYNVHILVISTRIIAASDYKRLISPSHCSYR